MEPDHCSRPLFRANPHTDRIAPLVGSIRDVGGATVADATVLVIRAVKDPQTRRGLPERDPDDRLGLLLKRIVRDYGFRVEVCCDADRVELVPRAPAAEQPPSESP
jgi:hypothetical protein